eukprot:CAMPEP_0170861706 /NCGR_PEP_ID=MMETSP0734-20130129/18438_1 /TAXON_ID=186038 /ORGANISM="Fragilariopsis kerguelensis, Strain L26-C5" /LENGTH=459 /DNA_ID=CAMNT_0011235967 /DNA_START=48 /DNA_END=1427 /DNA_ORIENTATION=-
MIAISATRQLLLLLLLLLLQAGTGVGVEVGEGEGASSAAAKANDIVFENDGYHNYAYSNTDVQSSVSASRSRSLSSQSIMHRSLLPQETEKNKCKDDKSWLTESEYPDLKSRNKYKKKKEEDEENETEEQENTDEEPIVVRKQRNCKWVKRNKRHRCDAVGADGIRANVACKKSCKSCHIDQEFEDFQAGPQCDDANDVVYEATMGGKYYCDAMTNGQENCHKEPPRYFQYDTQTNKVRIRGETYHGTDYEAYGKWWICGLTYAQNYWNEAGGHGFIEFIMDHSLPSQQEQLEQAREEDYRPVIYYRSRCRIAILEAEKSMKVWANKEAPSVKGGWETTKPNATNYNLLWKGKRDDAHWTFSYCYGEKDPLYAHQMFFAVNHDAVVDANNGLLPPGDGTPEHDNGVRVDMSFKTTLVLSDEDKCKLKQQFQHLIIPREKKFKKKTKPYKFDPTKSCKDC